MEREYSFLLRKLWRVRWLVEFSIRLAWRPIRVVLRSRPLRSWSAGLAPIYYLCLDVRGEDWWIKDYPDFHSTVFYTLLVVTGLTTIIQSFSPTEDDKMLVTNRVLSGFTANVGMVVETKIRRFRNKLAEITSRNSRFDEITQPREQIGVIASEACAFFLEFYGLNDNQVDITIAKRRLPDGGWTWYYHHQDWRHSDPNQVFKEGSAGHNCCMTGARAFFPDKATAHISGSYVQSKRDKARGSGSIYLYPVVIKGPRDSFEFVISIVTYGKCFCPLDDKAAVQATGSFLREFCRRFELELCLGVLKDTEWPANRRALPREQEISSPPIQTPSTT